MCLSGAAVILRIPMPRGGMQRSDDLRTANVMGGEAKNLAGPDDEILRRKNRSSE